MLRWFKAEAACASRWKRLNACGSLEASSGIHRDKSVQARIFALVDNAHSTAAELLDNAIVGDGLANHKGRKRFRVPVC